MLRRLSALALGFLLCMAVPAYAGDDKGKHHGKDKGYDHSHHHSAKGVPPGWPRRAACRPGSPRSSADPCRPGSTSPSTRGATTAPGSWSTTAG